MTGSSLEEPGTRQLGPGSSTSQGDPLLSVLENAAEQSKPAAEQQTDAEQPAAVPKGGKGKTRKKGTPAQQAHWAHLAELNKQRAKERKENRSKGAPNAKAAADATAAAEDALRGSRSSSSDSKIHSGPVFDAPPGEDPAGSGPKLSDLELETMCKVAWWGLGKVAPKKFGGGELEDEECAKLAAVTMPIIREALHNFGGAYGLAAVTVLGVFGSRAIAYRMAKEAEGE